MGKFFSSERTELMRSQIKAAAYNPRKISSEGYKALKKSIKIYGVVGGIVINRRTGNTIVGGHQKVAVLDELNKYNDGGNDYPLQVDLIDVDEKTEKELNITLNNANVGGEWDMDLLKELMPDIDYVNVGFSEADLSIIGVEKFFETEAENSLADDIAGLMSSSVQVSAQPQPTQQDTEAILQKLPHQPELTVEEKKAHVKAVKERQKEIAQNRALEAESYVVVSFDDIEGKQAFCEMFGYEITDRFIKGEDLLMRLEEGGAVDETNYDED